MGGYINSMIKALLFCSVLSMLFDHGSSDAQVLHEYLAREIPHNTEGVMYSECIHEPNDTIELQGRLFVIIRQLD